MSTVLRKVVLIEFFHRNPTLPVLLFADDQAL
jgi:hypothetical protein